MSAASALTRWLVVCPLPVAHFSVSLCVCSVCLQILIVPAVRAQLPARMKKAKIAAGESASSSAAAAAAAPGAAAASSSASISSSASQWTLPSAHDLSQSVRLFRSVPAPRPKLDPAPTGKGKGAEKKRKSTEPALKPEVAAAIKAAEHDLKRYLLLVANSAVLELNAGLLGDQVAAHAESPLEVVYRSPSRIIEQLVGSLGADIAFRDEKGFSAVHWMMFDAIDRPRGEAVVSGEGSARTVDLSGLARYAVEPILDTLLRCSESAGFFNEWREDFDDAPQDDEEEEEKKSEAEKKKKRSLMDLQDHHGNTPLHWAVHFRRVDLVGMLLLHGASVAVKNKAGQTPFDMVEWDAQAAGGPAAAPAAAAMVDVDEEAKSAAATTSAASSSAAAAASSSSAAAPASASSIYASQGHALERRWGTHEGLRIDQCSYEGESDSAAIKRLLFQAQLFHAVNEGDFGKLDKVKELVTQWKQAEHKGKRMFPLVYRSDVAWHHPLRVCVAYENGDTAILSELLRLPINLHIQSAIPAPHALHEACAVEFPTAREKLIKAGCDINLRDLRTGATALSFLFTTLPSTSENPAAFNDRLLTTARWLTSQGADPRVCTDQGNDALSFLVFKPEPLRLSILQHLISVVREKDPKWIREHTNAYGSTLMHYALHQRFDAECDLAQLEALIAAGARVDGPENRAGQKPLQCFAGLKGKHCGAALKLLKIAPTPEQAKAAAELAVHGAPRAKLAAHTLKMLVSDLSGGEAAIKVHLKSEFVDSSAESIQPLLSDFAYSSIHVGSDALPGWREYEYHLERLFYGKGKELESYTTLRKRIDAQAEDPGSSCVAPALVALSRLEVRETAHKGLGLFAAQPIAAEKEENVKGVECCGELVTPAQASERERAYALQGQIGFVVRPDRLRNPASLSPSSAMIVDQRRTGNLSRFFNHSCVPNCAKYLISNDQRIVIYPIGGKEIRSQETRGTRAIAGHRSDRICDATPLLTRSPCVCVVCCLSEDEELTINYFAFADQAQWTEPAHTILCQCGSAKCRRKLVAIPEDTPSSE